MSISFIRYSYILFLWFLLFFLLACTTKNYAPVNNAWSPNSERKGEYTVRKGDTLYSIAWRYNMDYRALAYANHLSSPYSLYVGQLLSLNILTSKPKLMQASPSILVQQNSGWAVKTPPIVYVAPINKSTESKSNSVVEHPKPVVSTQKYSKNEWIWPAKGKIIAKYAPSAGEKGIDIAGIMGEPVYATTTGKVAYAGNGLRGYGNLVIIKHNDEFLSAYAHNQKLLVHEGQDVKAGQIIATMGNSEAKYVMLHFEIREAGKSVDPLNYVKP